VYGEKEDTGVQIREKRGPIIIDVVFQKAMVPEFLHGHITKLGHISASCLAPVLGGMKRSPRTPTSPAPCCNTPLPIHGDMRDPSSVRKFGLCGEKHAVGSRCP